MKIRIINNLEFDIYDNTKYEDISNIEKYIKQVITKLFEIYKIKLEGFYNIIVYIDKYNGMVLHFEKEDLSYYDYFKGQIEFKINIKYVEFLYLIDDLYDEINLTKGKEIVIKDKKIYIKLNKKISKKDNIYLMEYSKIVYDY